ncbi:MAG: NAD(+)/NADH kinase [Elusimicrobiota bacterium]
MIKKVSLFYNRDKPKAKEVADAIKESALKRDIDIIIDEITPESDLVFSVGGDGTMLKTARQAVVFDVPVVCISVGTLGFLGIDPGEIEKGFEYIFNEDFELEERIMIEAETEGSKFRALNEIVVKNGPTARIINLELMAGGKKVYHLKGDGLIVSTPTGSTAYSLAAGGPIVSPDLQLIVVTPLNPHSFSCRSVVLDNMEVEIRSLEEGEEVILTADGQESMQLNPPTEVNIKIMKKKLKLVKSNKEFFDILSQKMNWDK